MEGGPVVLLGQGEQYGDPEDWRELMRTRRIRRGVELAVRRHGLTTLLRPEEVPELAAVLDQIDPPGPPSQASPPTAMRPAPAAPASSVPLSSGRTVAPAALPPSAAPAAVPSALPTPAPRKRWRFGVWRWVFAIGALLLVRLCAQDGFGGLPAFGTRADAGKAAPASSPSPAACARPRGWIAKAACDDPDFARLRPTLARAYADRLSGLSGDARRSLADGQARWQASRSACRSAPDPGSCLADRYRARLTELQSRGEAAPPADAFAAPSPPSTLAAVEAVDRPEWVRRPGADELADAYPERALRLDIDGRALLSCRATASGGLTACDVVSEEPTDYGFGAAALRLSRFYGIAPRTADGRPVDGARVDLPVAFKGG